MPANRRTTERIHAIWDALADYPLARAEDALRYLLDGICTLINAKNATWIGAVRLSGDFPNDPLSGWRPRVVSHLHAFPELVKGAQQGVKDIERGEMDTTTIRNVAGAGTFRVNRLADIVPPEWFESPYYQVTYLNKGHEDAIWAGVPVNDDAESYFGVYRALGAPRFSAEDRDLVGYALRALKWFHRRQMLSHGLLIAETPLTPAERKVLHGLLSGGSEKEIASQIGQSYNTTHAHVGTLYRKFGVKNRAGLLSLWIGGS